MAARSVRVYTRHTPNFRYGDSCRSQRRVRCAVPLGGARNIDLSWDIVNVTNRVNLENPTGNRASANFMVPNTVGFRRQMQVGLRFRF
jgi:hypothetical protein